ncbi:MAG: AAA family ATPase [Mycobacteriales bacterium]
MRIPVLTAVTDALWEAELVSALEREDLGVTVVRRCVDLADLLATAAAGTARAVLLSADLRRLDQDALAQLTAAGVAVVGLVPPGDEDADRRLRQLGVAAVLAADSGPALISAAVVQAVSVVHLAVTDGGARHQYGDPRAALPILPESPPPGAAGLPDRPAGRGRVVAVWGPTGAPGRTTVAVGLAAELARLGTATLLVDADVYGGVVAQVVGLLDEAPGLAAAARLANAGNLDLPGLARLAAEVSPALRVLTGISRPDRWLELRPAALAVVLGLARSLAEVTVVDCGFSLEQDEELAYDTTAPRRNGATLAVLADADTVLAVGAADPVSLARLVRGLAALRETLPDIEPRVVVNRLRRGAVQGDPETEVRAALERYAGISSVEFVPYDRGGVDAARLRVPVVATRAGTGRGS